MTIVALSDTHGHHREAEIPAGDCIIHCGDFTWKSNLAEVKDFLEWFSALDFRYKILVAGNHDRFVERKCSDFMEMISACGIYYLENSSICFEGIHLYGSPFTREYDAVGAFLIKNDSSARMLWEQIPDETDILITHGAPQGFGDFSITEGIHSGCRQLLQRIHTIKPAYHVFGHIHEGYGVYSGDNTVFINAALTDRTENLIHEPIVFDYTR